MVKAVILVAVVLSTITLVTLRVSIDNAHDQYERMRMQAAVLEERNAMLTKNLEELGSVDSVIRIAMEELGLVLPDTTFFDPEEEPVD